MSRTRSVHRRGLSRPARSCGSRPRVRLDRRRSGFHEDMNTVPCQVFVFTSVASSAWWRAVVLWKGWGRPPNGLDERFLSGRLCLVHRPDVGRFDEIDEPVRVPVAERVGGRFSIHHWWTGAPITQTLRSRPEFSKSLGCGLTLSSRQESTARIVVKRMRPHRQPSASLKSLPLSIPWSIWTAARHSQRSPPSWLSMSPLGH